MDSKLAKVYCSLQSYCKGIASIKKLAEAVNVPEETLKPRYNASRKFDLWAHGPKRGPSFSATVQAFVSPRVYKYGLTVVNAS